MQRSLFVELLRQQIITALIPISIIGGVFWLFIFPRVTNDLTLSHEAIAISVSEQVDSYLESAAEQLKLVAIDIINSPNSSSLSNQLDGFVQVSNIFSTIYTTDVQNSIKHIGLKEHQIPIRKLYVGMDLSFFTRNESKSNSTKSNNNQYWSNVFISPITGFQSLSIEQELGGVSIIAEIDIEQLPALAQSLSNSDLLVMVLDESNNLIAHPNPELSQHRFNLGYSSIIVDTVETMQSGEFLWENTNYHVSIVPLKTTHWKVIVAQPTKEFNATIRFVTQLWLFISLSTISLTALIALREATILSRSSLHLQSMAGSVTSGDYNVSVTQSPINEFNEVAQSFNKMAQQVRDREADLTQLNTELEGRVEERTQALTAINEELIKNVVKLENTMEHLVQSEKLAALGSLVAGVAHELNTPIGNAKIAVSSQQDYIRDFNKAKADNSMTKTMLEQFISDIAETSDMGFRNMERATKLIRSFKQLAVDQTTSHHRDFDLNEVISEVMITMNPMLKTKPVTTKIEIPDNIKMSSTPGPLTQVLSNLINNAIHHGLADQDILTISIIAHVDDDNVVIAVSDTGVGMPEEDQKKAFDPFFTTKMGQGGSGLGLNIVHRLVVGMLKGNISLASTVGRGTTFTLTLPLAVENTVAEDINAHYDSFDGNL